MYRLQRRTTGVSTPWTLDSRDQRLEDVTWESQPFRLYPLVWYVFLTKGLISWFFSSKSGTLNLWVIAYHSGIMIYAAEPFWPRSNTSTFSHVFTLKINLWISISGASSFGFQPLRPLGLEIHQPWLQLLANVPMRGVAPGEVFADAKWWSTGKVNVGWLHLRLFSLLFPFTWEIRRVWAEATKSNIGSNLLLVLLDGHGRFMFWTFSGDDCSSSGLAKLHTSWKSLTFCR